MAEALRKKALDTLLTLVDTVSVTTAEVTQEKGDVATYVSSSLPLIRIYPGLEVADPDEVGMMGFWRFRVSMTLFFLADDDEESSAREPLVKEVKDALGSDITLSGNCAECRLLSVTEGGAWPLWESTFALEIRYEAHLKNA